MVRIILKSKDYEVGFHAECGPVAGEFVSFATVRDDAGGYPHSPLAHPGHRIAGVVERVEVFYREYGTSSESQRMDTTFICYVRETSESIEKRNGGPQHLPHSADMFEDR